MNIVTFLFLLYSMINSNYSEPTNNYIKVYLKQSKTDVHELFYLTNSSIKPYFNETEKIRFSTFEVNRDFTLTYSIPSKNRIKRFRIDPGKTAPNSFAISKIELVTEGKKITYSPKEIMNHFYFNQYIKIDSTDQNYIYLKTHKVKSKFDPFFYISNDLIDELEIKNKKNPKFIKMELSVEKEDLMYIKCVFENEEMNTQFYKATFPNSTFNIIYCSLPNSSNLKSLVIYPSSKQPNTILFKQISVSSTNINTVFEGSEIQKRFSFNSYVKKTKLNDLNQFEISTHIVKGTYSPSMTILDFAPSYTAMKIALVIILLWLINNYFFSRKLI